MGCTRKLMEWADLIRQETEKTAQAQSSEARELWVVSRSYMSGRRNLTKCLRSSKETRIPHFTGYTSD